jgi:hypothetical protein
VTKRRQKLCNRSSRIIEPVSSNPDHQPQSLKYPPLLHILRRLDGVGELLAEFLAAQLQHDVPALVHYEDGCEIGLVADGHGMCGPEQVALPADALAYQRLDHLVIAQAIRSPASAAKISCLAPKTGE